MQGAQKLEEGAGYRGEGVEETKKQGSFLHPTPNPLHPFLSCNAADGLFTGPSFFLSDCSQFDKVFYLECFYLEKENALGYGFKKNPNPKF
jgi:hypothetical protein